MNKVQLAVALVAGAAIGVGGGRLIEPGVAKTAPPFVQAVDLRRQPTLDAGVLFAVWASRLKVDGGAEDIGPAADCAPSVATRKSALQLMESMARECEWRR